MGRISTGFVLIHISLLMMILLLGIVIKMKNKKQIHFVFLVSIITMIIWTIGAIIIEYFNRFNISITLPVVSISYIGLILMPVVVLFLGLIFAKTRIDFSWKYALFFIIPVVSLILLFTNDYHHLFYKYIKYEDLTNINALGKYFIVHTIYSYICIFIGMAYLIIYSIKNAGFFSKQSILIFLGITIPFIYNIILTSNIIKLYFYTNVIAFSFVIICFAFAIFKFNFLNMIPIALQKIVDLISDSYIVINEDFEIIDFNQTLLNTFSGVMIIKRKMNFLHLISNSKIQVDNTRFKEKILFANEQKKTIAFEEHLTGNQFNRYFEIEITPIYSEQNFLGSIILFKDISEHKKNIETIKHNQEIIMEQERLASLGQLIGGIAHNLKTPIMSIAGGIEAIKDLTDEYKESIADPNVTREDHYEIVAEMQEWLEKMKPYCSYMTDVISAVKGQAVQMNYAGSDKFTVEDLVKRIDVLMKHELKKYHCVLHNDFQIDLLTEIKGELNSLVQVFDNIIMNAVQAYEGKNGIIDFHISQKGHDVEFILKDYGKGIPKEIQNKLFKEMLTTKGKNGTGLGLYMSYSTIKGRFSGNMRFETEENCGTAFFITIPCINHATRQEA